MSMDYCFSCDKYVDTDDDPDFYMGVDGEEGVCSTCRDRRGYCENCEDVLDKDGNCYHKECRVKASMADAEDRRLDDPRHEGI